MGKKYLTIPLLFLLVLTLFFAIQQNNMSSLVVFAAGTPDSYGNRIRALYCQDYNGSTWIMSPHCVTSDGTLDYYWPNLNTSNYICHAYSSSSPYQWRVYDAKPLRLWCSVWLNYSFASTSSEAKSYMKIYCNITGGGYSLTNQEFTYGSCDPIGVVYWEMYNNYYTWNATGKPNAGTTYTITVWYNAYY